jgi:glycine/D-amino acid oxidase-like deaminating enzyme
VKRPVLRAGQPVWLRHTGPASRQYPILSGRHDASVAIVGGGITGALVAHAFASAGVSTILLESSVMGRGSTAASSALLLEEPDRELTQLIDRYGTRRARRIWRVSQESVHELAALLRKLGVDCDLQARDAVYYAADDTSADRLKREYEVRLRSGFDATWLDPAALQRVTGISGRGAIRTHGSAQCDPFLACQGILQAAASAGAQLFERSRVRRISTTGDEVRLHTRHGLVTADRVVIATGYATPQFRPLTGRFRMHRTYVLATAPLTAAQRRQLGLGDVLIWDAERPYHYARWTRDHRLLLGGADRPVRPREAAARLFTSATRELRAYFEGQFPLLTRLDTPLEWEGLFAMTPDSLPYIGPHRRYPRHWFALGYGGNGMTFSFLAARLLLERWTGRKSGDHALFEFGRLR